MKTFNVEQGTEEWFELRLGIPTASMFDKVVTSKGEMSKQVDQLIYEKAFERLTGIKADDWQGNHHTERGNELEDEACRAYEIMTDRECKAIGFVTDDKHRWGCSPDRLVGDGLLEIKCPSNKVMMEYLDKDRLPAKYWQQVQGQMMVCEKEWCDFLAYNQYTPPLLVTVKRDDNFCDKLEKALIEVDERIQELHGKIKNM